MTARVIVLLLTLFIALWAKNGIDRKKKLVYAYQKEDVSEPKPLQKTELSRYFGIEAMYGMGKQKTRTEYSSFSDEPLNYSEVSFKLGFGAYDKNRLELSLTQNKSFILNDSSASSDFASGMSADIAYLVLLDFLQSAISNDIYPFIKIGSGLAKFDIKDEHKSDYGTNSIYATEFKLGLGVSSMPKERMELSIFYNTVSREFQPIENYDSRLIEISHDVNSLSFGVNYRF